MIIAQNKISNSTVNDEGNISSHDINGLHINGDCLSPNVYFDDDVSTTEIKAPLMGWKGTNINIKQLGNNCLFTRYTGPDHTGILFNEIQIENIDMNKILQSTPVRSYDGSSGTNYVIFGQLNQKEWYFIDCKFDLKGSDKFRYYLYNPVFGIYPITTSKWGDSSNVNLFSMQYRNEVLFFHTLLNNKNITIMRFNIYPCFFQIV